MDLDKASNPNKRRFLAVLIKSFICVIWIILILSLLAIPILAMLIAGFYYSEKGHSGPVTDHFNGKTFINPSGRYSNGIKEVIKHLTTRKPDKWNENYETDVRKAPLPLNQSGKVNITFVNHSSFIIHYEEYTILTDPIWSQRCSPFQMVGPIRMRPPGVKYEDIRKVDIVLISHNHYDHLDKVTVKRLIRDFDPLFIVPLGVEHLIHKWGSSRIVRLDWWQDVSKGPLTITSVPSNHFSSRGAFDRDRTLWTGYVLEYEGYKVYFVGDSGYSDIFKTIGERIGPMDVSLVPIGAYMPDWFMSPIHVCPNEAVCIHKDVKSKQSIAMHFGTFALADDGPETPIRDLKEALQDTEIPEEKFIIPDEGRSYEFVLEEHTVKA